MAKEIRASHILVNNEEHAKQLLEEIKKGVKFEDLAKKFSKCPSGSKGGDLGFFGKGMMVPQFENAAFKLKIGEISSLIKTQFGYHLIKKTDEK